MVSARADDSVLINRVVPPAHMDERADFVRPSLEIPAIAELALLHRWVCFKIEERKGKRTKVPYQPNGRPASTTDPKTWRSFGACCAAVEAGHHGFAGVGFVFIKDPHAPPDALHYVGIDIDGCRDPKTGKIDDETREIIDRFKSYTEISPSGTGVHILVKGWLPAGGRRVGKIECYQDRRYFTVTGQQLDDWPDEIEGGQEALDWLSATHIRPNGQSDGVHGQGDTDAKIELPFDAPQVDPQALKALLINDDAGKIRATFEAKRRERRFKKPDGSPDWSKYDLALLTLAALRGWPELQLWALLVAFRNRHGADVGKALRRDYAERTIAKASVAAIEHQAKVEAARLAAEVEQAALAADTRPLLWVQPGRITTNVAACQKGLNAARFDQSVFQRGPERW